MTNEELGQLLDEIKSSYNTLLEQIVKGVMPAMSVEKAVKIEGWKEGAEMAFVAICHTILSCYGVEADLELSDGRKIALGEPHHDQQRTSEQQEPGND